LLIEDCRKNYAFSYTALGKSGPAGQQWRSLVVLGFRCQGVEVLDPETLYETSLSREIK
jgi:hypothetical protein